MKNIDLEQESVWPSAEQVEEARENLRQRLIEEDLERAARSEAVNGLIKLLKVDRETLRRLWIQPLLMAGATLDMALASIAKSQFLPN